MIVGVFAVVLFFLRFSTRFLVKTYWAAIMQFGLLTAGWIIPMSLMNEGDVGIMSVVAIVPFIGVSIILSIAMFVGDLVRITQARKVRSPHV